VAPHFNEFARSTKRASAAQHGERSLKLTEFLQRIYRAVLLGNPGGGKSTLKDKLCFDLAANYLERPMGGRRLTPIPVILRDYGAEKKAHNMSIVQFMESVANSSYQLSPPRGAFEYLLLNGRILVIFDGLDELLETNYRQKITADVESFCSIYPAVPILVTSREVGYEQAPLDDERFEAFRLAPFDENQISEYVTKWFRADTDLTPPQQQQKTKAFLKESRVVPDLRSNPLMLALMCNIYRGENYIPQNRPDLYDKCAVMLFERWDKSRGIVAPLPFEAHIRPAMMYLAHWIYTNDNLQSGVVESKLIEKTSEYLLEHQYDDQNEAEFAARTFIEFCRGRAWVFTDTGAGLYQFTHRTFLEYFTAFHLVRKYSTAESLLEGLFKRIARREWDIVAQLSIQLLNKHAEGAADHILTTLANSSATEPGVDGLNLIYFAARCLHFIVPSPRVRKLITGICLDRYLKSGKSRRHEVQVEPLHYSEETREGALGALLKVSLENRPIVAKAVTDWLSDKIINGSPKDGGLATEITMMLPYSSRPNAPDESVQQFWRELSEEIFQRCRDKIRLLEKTQRAVAAIAFWRRELTLVDLINVHGLQAAFSRFNFRIFPMVWSPANQLLGPVISGGSYSIASSQGSTSQLAIQDSVELARLGSWLLSTETPWLKLDESETFSVVPYIFDYVEPIDGGIQHLEPDVLFGGTLVIALGLEQNALQKETLHAEQRKFIEKSRANICKYVRSTFLARFEPVDQDILIEEWEKSGFSEKQRDFLHQWVNKTVNLISRKSRTHLGKPKAANLRKRVSRKTGKKR
jgi:hypothetical protein